MNADEPTPEQIDMLRNAEKQLLARLKELTDALVKADDGN